MSKIHGNACSSGEAAKTPALFWFPLQLSPPCMIEAKITLSCLPNSKLIGESRFRINSTNSLTRERKEGDNIFAESKNKKRNRIKRKREAFLSPLSFCFSSSSALPSGFAGLLHHAVLSEIDFPLGRRCAAQNRIALRSFSLFPLPLFSLYYFRATSPRGPS